MTSSPVATSWPIYTHQSIFFRKTPRGEKYSKLNTMWTLTVLKVLVLANIQGLHSSVSCYVSIVYFRSTQNNNPHPNM